MEFKNVFDPTVLNELLGRLDKLQPEAQRQWGKMEPAQMMAHCSSVLERATGDEKPSKRPFIGYLMGPLVRTIITNDKPFKQNSPTGKEFLIKDDKDFGKEKERLANVLTRFSRGGVSAASNRRHPFIGKFSAEEWNKSTYKHLDHHFRQFGV